MRQMKFKVTAVAAIAAILMTSCGMNNVGKGSLIGGGAGAALGAGIGAIIGDGKGAAIGAAIGGAVGAGTGAIIGNKMDKQKAELEKIEGAEVEDAVDVNGLPGIKVTFADGILFATNSSKLSSQSQQSLKAFAQSLAKETETDITIYGHTDNTGSLAVNEKVSAERAQSVKSFFTSNGISGARIATKGMAYNMPVADNATKEGKAKNRRVEIYITANETMIKQAEQGK